MTIEPTRPRIPPWPVALRRIGELALFLLRRPRAVLDLPRWIRDCFTVPTTRREPWWPYPMIRLMAIALPAKARVFEFGCGGSTLWLEDRGARITSVEHDRQWYALIRAAARSSETTLRLVEPSADGRFTSVEAPGQFFDAYVAAADGLDPASQDLVIVDGRARVECALRAASKVRPGGWLMLDDSNRDRYRAVHEALHGWSATTVGGLKPGGLFGTETTIWRRPLAG